jgi:hypothetical protein
MQWTASGGDPAAFLTRLAELVREKRMTVAAIGPLERQATPQFSKSWHTIQVVAPYREIRELAMRVEGDKGILEDVRLEPAPASAGRAAAAPGPEEVQARFRLVALDLSPAARKVLDRALAASGPGAGAPSPGVPGLARAAAPDPISRDPFAFAIPKVASRPGSPAPRPDKPPAPMELTAIVGFPGGFLAIVNNQIVKTGDVVNGHRVEKITDRLVSLREPGGLARTLELPELGAAQAAPRR